MIENMKVTVKTEHSDSAFVLTFDDSFESDRDMKTMINRFGACEPEVVHLLGRVVKPGDTVIDGGANVGFFTCLMAQLVGKHGMVYAVEPAPANIRKLEHNLANNKFGNVRVVKSPLSSSHHETTLYLSSHSGFNSLEPCAETVGRMKTVATTIDAVLDGDIPKLIKLDIEGAEGRALKGAFATLPKCPYVVVELNEAALGRFGSSRSGLRQQMADIGYDMFLLSNDGILPHLVPKGSELVCSRQNLMVLFATQENVAKAWPTVELT